MHDYESFTRRFLLNNSNIQQFQTNVVIDHVKVGLSIPIEVDEDA
jgi:hypothetical protein